MQKGKILGLDWGAKRIGVSISDKNQQMAFGRTSIENKSQDYVLEKLHEIITKEDIIAIILGYPLNMQAEKTKSTVKVEQFKALLEKHLRIPVILHDERLTSVESGSIITSLNIKTKDKKKETDIIAASLILKNYLDLQREKTKGEK